MRLKHSAAEESAWDRHGSLAAARELERGGVILYTVSPFSLVPAADHEFLLRQRLAVFGHKNIGYNPVTGKVAGFVRQGGDQVDRLKDIFAHFSQTVTAWLGQAFPYYHRYAELDRVSYRPEQEATRKLRKTSRNDLLHVDAFPGRPSLGRRILRVFANINPLEPRVWITAEPFAELLRKYGATAGLPGYYTPPLLVRLRHGLNSVFRPGRPARSDYDSFMLRFHDWLKCNDAFQKGCPKRRWEFEPGSVWVAFTDTCSHAVLSGRFALEHSYFVAHQGLRLPDESPPNLLAQFCESRIVAKAA